MSEAMTLGSDEAAPAAHSETTATTFVEELRSVRRSYRKRTLVTAVAVAVAAVLATLAVSEATRSDPSLDLRISEVEVVEASIQTISREVQLTAIASWERDSDSPAPRAGIVTEVFVESMDSVNVGSALYSIDLLSSYAAEGPVPAFRDLDVGDRGADVEQLQRFLTSLGHYDADIDGRFGLSTRDAVRRWQETIGSESTGRLLLGDLQFFPDLPTRVAVSDTFRVGASVAVGQPALVPLSEEPRLWIPLTRDQLDLVPPGAQVEIDATNGPWIGAAGEVVASDEIDVFDVLLNGPVLCDESACVISVDPNAETALSALVIQVPPTRGVVLPAAALRSAADGSTTVELEDGTYAAVEVQAEARGLVVVDGIDEGTRVVVG